jgi:predicted nucleotidyltransferase
VPTVDLPDVALDAVLRTLADYVPDRAVRVMGSRANGRAKPFSDLDIVIMGDEPLDLRTLGRLRDAFDESSLPFAVDIIEWASASDAFRRVIDQQARPLGPATTAAGRQ